MRKAAILIIAIIRWMIFSSAVHAAKSSKGLPWLPLLLLDDASARLNYTFDGGSINDLRAVSPSLEFGDLTIKGFSFPR